MISSLAAAEATLTDTEKELGVLVADIGGGTTDIAIFTDGAVYHSAVLPVGGINVTNDVAIGLRTSLNLAEEIKIKHGTANLGDVGPEELLNVAVLGEGGGQTIQRRKLCEIIAARMRRSSASSARRSSAPGHAGMLPAGVVLTGGGARIARGRGAGARRARDAGPDRGAAGRRRADGPAQRIPPSRTPIGLLPVGRAPRRGGAGRLRGRHTDERGRRAIHGLVPRPLPRLSRSAQQGSWTAGASSTVTRRSVDNSPPNCGKPPTPHQRHR